MQFYDEINNYTVRLIYQIGYSNLFTEFIGATNVKH